MDDLIKAILTERGTNIIWCLVPPLVQEFTRFVLGVPHKYGYNGLGQVIVMNSGRSWLEYNGRVLGYKDPIDETLYLVRPDNVSELNAASEWREFMMQFWRTWNYYGSPYGCTDTTDKPFTAYVAAIREKHKLEPLKEQTAASYITELRFLGLIEKRS